MGKNKKKNKDHDVDLVHRSEEKPLPKLVLKVGREKRVSDSGNMSGSSEYAHHKKKKKKHKHKLDEAAGRKQRKREATECSESEPQVKRVHRNKDKDKKKEFREPDVSPLNLCLDNLHRTLQRKDVYGIFTNPVTDLIAPGYSKIIKKPMDFCTISRKIEESQYIDIGQFKEDYSTMCKNAMLYNGPDTIYYKSAEKMLAIGLKMMSKEKIKKIKKSLGLPYSDDEEDIVQIDDSSDVNVEYSTEETPSPKKRTPDRKSKRENTKSHSAIASLILAASREARQKLLNKYPKQKYGYLSTDEEGNTALNVLNPGSIEEDQSVPVNLGELAGKLKTGLPTSQIVYKEDKKNKVVPVNYLFYGPYGSFGPSYDSSLSNTTKDESEVLLRTYGTGIGVQYAKSVTRFTKDAPLAADYVEKLLDVITGGAHSKMKAEETKTNDAEDGKSVEMSNCEKPPDTSKDDKKIDLDSLLTLNGLGIDVSFLKDISTAPSMGGETKTKATTEIAEKLQENSELLNELKETQHERLAKGGKANITATEMKIATSLTNNITDLLRMVKPQDVIASEGVRLAIGKNNVLKTTEPINSTPNLRVMTARTTTSQQPSLEPNQRVQVSGEEVDENAQAAMGLLYNTTSA